jgi:predicted RND superfamily exporter protein
MVLSRAPGRPILTRVNLRGLDEYKAVTNAMDREGIPYVAYYGPQFGRYVIGLIYREMLRVSAITIVLVLVILISYTRSLRRLTLIIAPLLLSLLWTFGVMGWLGLRINLMNSMVVVFIFGVVVDYSIFIATSLERARGEDDPYLTHASVATLMTALTTMSGLGVLILARHPALRSIGVTALLGIGTGLGAVFLLIPLSKKYPLEIDMEK